MTVDKHLNGSCPRCSRRSLLRAGLGSTAALAAGAVVPSVALANSTLDPFRGRPLPKPIPHINPGNGQHTFPVGPFAEPSNIYDFKGYVGEVNIMGTGKDGNGTPLFFGGPTTDLRFQHGMYVAEDGKQYDGTFIHI
ncbi:MAG: hypothetical protein PVSMB5_05290 [Ktedonobacteraceae bacterium]